MRVINFFLCTAAGLGNAAWSTTDRHMTWTSHWENSQKGGEGCLDEITSLMLCQSVCPGSFLRVAVYLFIFRNGPEQSCFREMQRTHLWDL